MNMQMEGSYVFTVVLTGLVVVFIGLILLIIFVSLMGKIFDNINANKSDTNNKTEKKTIAESKAAPQSPVIEDGISDEIVAVITAAVASMNCTVSSIRLSKKSAGKASRRTAWGNQGVLESTEVF